MWFRLGGPGSYKYRNSYFLGTHQNTFTAVPPPGPGGGAYINEYSNDPGVRGHYYYYYHHHCEYYYHYHHQRRRRRCRRRRRHHLQYTVYVSPQMRKPLLSSI